MNWKNNRQNDSCLFRELSVGKTFEYEEVFYIKISKEEAFDIINNRITKDYWNDIIVQPVSHEIIITD